MKSVIKIVFLTAILFIFSGCSKDRYNFDCINNKWWEVEKYTVDGADSTTILKADTAYKKLQFNYTPDNIVKNEGYYRIWQCTGQGNYRELGINWNFTDKGKNLSIANVDFGGTIWNSISVMPIRPFRVLTFSEWEICAVTDNTMQITLKYDSKRYIITFKKSDCN